MKTVIEMAMEVRGSGLDWWLSTSMLERFAEMVRAQENEACALIADEAEPYNAADLIRKRMKK